MHQTKLVRKQLLLDVQDLFYIEQIIKNQAEYTSLSQYVRELLKKQIQEKKQTKIKKKQKLLDLAGSIRPSKNSDSKAATNHNEIYNI